MNIKNILNNYKDTEYKKFHQKLCKTKYEILGIRLPILRNITKDLVKKYNYQDLLNNIDNFYYEEIMLQGLVISYTKIDYDERLSLIDKFMPKIDNWAICDTFCSSLKFIKRNEDEFLKYIQKYLTSNKEYFLRFGIVILLDYYINDTYIDYVLNKMLEIKSNYYYANMAISWCLSICLIKYFNKTKEFLEINKSKFDKWTYNKALQKAIESFRINKNNKNILKNMKV